MFKYRQLIIAPLNRNIFKTYNAVTTNLTICDNCVEKFTMPITQVQLINHNRFSTKSENVATFEDMLKFIKDKKRLIIDVREPSELKETGAIPHSVNIPLGEVETALKDMPDQEFIKKYGIEKPAKDDPLVFYCRIGVRSGKAMETARNLKYKSVLNYLGSWTEWAEKYKKP